jgi:ribulose-phosphate 3-epimerase
MMHMKAGGDKLIRISPSLLAANVLQLGDEISAAAAGGPDLFHCDIMDGSFVPTISFGYEIVSVVKDHAHIPLDIHLMVVDPDAQVDLFARLNPEIITFHVEAVSSPSSLIDKIHNLGIRAGVSIKPESPIEPLLELLPSLDLILVMTVEPGAGGQPFMVEMLPKVAALSAAIREGGHSVMLEVDGGINAETVAAAARAGADTFVAGTAIFRHLHGPAAAISELREIALRVAIDDSAT